jgi:hypothetical protein
MWGEIRVERYRDERGAWCVLSQRHDDGRCRVRTCFSADEERAVQKEWMKAD